VNKIKFALTTIIVSIILVLVYFLTFNLAEPKAYDFMTKNFLTQRLPFDNYKKLYGSDDIVLVMTDAKTIEKYRWPWARNIDCEILKYFTEYAKPKLIADDTILITPDATNPQADINFYKTIKNIDNYVAGFMPSMFPWKDKASGEKYSKYFNKKFSIEVKDEDKKEIIAYYSMLTSPYPYLNSVKHLGHIYIPVGGIDKNISSWAFDNITRTNEFVLKYEEGFYPSLAMKSFLLLNPDSEIKLKNRTLIIDGKNKRKIKLLKNSYLLNKFKKVKIQTYSNPIRFYKIYSKTGYSHKNYSIGDIIDSYRALKLGKKPIIDPEVFRDKIVVLGANVPAGAGLNDNKNSSIAVNHPGTDLQATVIDNIINNDFITVVPTSINILLTIFCMLLVYSFIRIMDLFKSVISTLMTMICYIIFGITCFYFGIVINIITPLVMIVLTTVLAYTHKFVLENKSKEKVKSAMGKFMSEDVMKRVVQNIDNLGLGGKKATVTVLFSDIRGFTSMSETMSAQDVSEILNEYFTEMEPIITKYNGIINKFIGDAVMAIFGEPIQDKNHAQNAVKCGYEMLKKVKELQKKWAKEDKPKIEIGIGINTGEVFVGNIGSINRMEYTVIGDTVNLASRLESYNKIYKTKMLISASTYEEIKGQADVMKISDVQIRGKANRMNIYEVLKIYL